MSRILRNTITFVLVMFLTVLVVHGEALSGRTIKGVMWTDPVVLDPAHLYQTQDRNVVQQVYQGLVTFDYTADPPYPVILSLAESYDISKDGKVITFRLHKGVQFHHGYGELTSEDVVFSLKRHLDPKVASRAKIQLEDVERIEAPDKYTVKIYLKVPSALSLIRSLAWQTAGFILNKKACAELGDKVAMTPIGTGPFYWDRWDSGEKVVLKKFNDYWGTPAKVDGVEFWVIPEEPIALGALEKGDLDMVPLTQLGSYDRAIGIKDRGKDIYIKKSPSGSIIYIYYPNHKMKPLDDLRVRKALAHALDLKGIVERIGPQVRHFPSPFASVAFAATDEFWEYEYDLDKARKLLAEAGYPNGFELRMIYTTGGLYEPIVLEVQRCWKEIVDVKIELVERGRWWKTISQYKHHVLAFGLARVTPYLFAHRYMCDFAGNNARYCNPELDEVIRKAKVAKTEQESRRYWREFQRMATEDVVTYWVVNGESLVAIKNELKGVKVLPTPGMVSLEAAYVE